MDIGGIERLRMLLSGVASTQNISISQPNNYELQKVQPTPDAFDVNSFQNEHDQRVETIKRLIQEQEKFEQECLLEYTKMEDERKILESKLESLQIIKSSEAESQKIRLELSNLKKIMTKETKIVQQKLFQFREYQQDVLASAGFPLFKVSSEENDLIKMHWVLAPYLASLK